MNPIQTTVATAATNAVIDVLNEQPWYKRYAGTITTLAGGVVTLATWLTTSGLALPTPVQVTLGVVALVASTLAARATKNGQTPRTSKEILDAIVPTVTEAVASAPGSLDRLVQDRADEAARAAAEQTRQAAERVIGGGPVGDLAGLVVSEAERAFLSRGR